MKIYYEKYDDTIQYLGNDTVPEWQPLKENIVVEFCNDQLIVQTEYESSLVVTLKMTVVENNNGRHVAHHLDEHMGMTVFIQSPEESDEATLTLMNHNYIVGRYLRRVKTTLT